MDGGGYGNYGNYGNYGGYGGYGVYGGGFGGYGYTGAEGDIIVIGQSAGVSYSSSSGTTGTGSGEEIGGAPTPDNPVIIQTKIDTTKHTEQVTVSTQDKTKDIKFDLGTLPASLNKISIDFHDGNLTYTGSVDVPSGFGTGTLGVNFGNGLNGTLSLGTNGSAGSVSAGLHVDF